MSVLETQSPESEDQLFRQSEHLLSQRSDWGPCEVINGAGCIVGGGGGGGQYLSSFSCKFSTPDGSSLLIIGPPVQNYHDQNVYFERAFEKSFLLLSEFVLFEVMSAN